MSAWSPESDHVWGLWAWAPVWSLVASKMAPIKDGPPNPQQSSPVGQMINRRFGKEEREETNEG